MLKFIRRNRTVGLAIVGLLLLLAIAGSFIIFSTSSPLASTPTGAVLGEAISRPAPLTWQVPGHAFSSEEPGAGKDFTVKAIMVSPTSIRFFYTLKADKETSPNQPGVTITATSTVPGCDGKNAPSTPLATQVQVLGHLAGYEVGVIHVLGWTDRLGQVISLKMEQPATAHTTASSWDLPALQQVDPITHRGWWGFNFNASSESPKVVFSGVSGLNFDRQAGFFWVDEAGKPVYNPPLIFAEIEQDDKVTTISQQEYTEIAGPLPQVYNRADIYPATPTLPGFTPPALKTPCQ